MRIGLLDASGTANGGTPGGAAGGFLSGTYPNPGVASDLASYPLKFGATPATTGDIRFSNNRSFFVARNAANSGNVEFLYIDAGNNLSFGSTAGIGNLTIAAGTSVPIAIGAQTIGTFTASKFVEGAGVRHKVATKTAAYNVAATDHIVSWALTDNATTYLPASPTAGDSYVIHVSTLEPTKALTINGNGQNVVIVGGTTTATETAISTNHTSITFTSIGSVWEQTP